MRNANMAEWWPSCCINRCFQPYHKSFRPGVLGHDFENWVWKALEIKEKEQEEERRGCGAIYIKSWQIELHGAKWWWKVLKRNGPMSFIPHITCVVVGQKSRGFKAFGWNWLYIDLIDLQLMMTLSIAHTNVEHLITISMSLVGASMEHQWYLIFRFQPSTGCIITAFHRGSVGCLYRQKVKWVACSPNKEMMVNGASMTFSLACWIFQGHCNSINP